MAIDLTLLKQELLNDPLNLGYAPYVSVRNDIGSHSVLTEVKSGSDFVVSRGRITKDFFIEITTQMVFNLMMQVKNGNNGAQFWLDVFDRLIANSDTINCDDAALSSILNQMLVENLINTSGIDYIKTKQGSRSEVLFGVNVSIDDVSNSLNEGDI
jgi:hypothetical protein